MRNRNFGSDPKEFCGGRRFWVSTRRDEVEGILRFKHEDCGVPCLRDLRGEVLDELTVGVFELCYRFDYLQQCDELRTTKWTGTSHCLLCRNWEFWNSLLKANFPWGNHTKLSIFASIPSQQIIWTPKSSIERPSRMFRTCVHCGVIQFMLVVLCLFFLISK